MAEPFHFKVTIISRGKGKSAVAGSAYISGEKIKNEWDGVTHDYTKKQGVLYKEVLLPKHAPAEFEDRKLFGHSLAPDFRYFTCLLDKGHIKPAAFSIQIFKSDDTIIKD